LLDLCLQDGLLFLQTQKANSLFSLSQQASKAASLARLSLPRRCRRCCCRGLQAENLSCGSQRQASDAAGCFLGLSICAGLQFSKVLLKARLKLSLGFRQL
jgi:hypothetical protein